jgi:hypothetical protein
MKTVPGAKWSKTLHCWHIPDTEENRKKCGLKTGDSKLPGELEASGNQNTQTSKTVLADVSSNNRFNCKNFWIY